KRQEEIAERRRQDEIQLAERKRKEEQEIELRKLEYEERKRKDEMEFELQKIRLGAEDDWSKLNSPDDLVEILDDYDTLRSTFRSKQPRKEWHYDKQNSFKDDSAFTTNEKKQLYGITHSERGEPKCFHCSNFGHIARNCSIPKSVLTCREGKRVHIRYREDELFRNFPIDEKVNPVCLKRLETAQLESESLQIKDTSQQKMMGNLANDLKMVNNELRLLQGDIKNFKEERQSLLLQIQEKNKNVDNLKSINDSLVKTNSYYDKNKSGKVPLRKGDIVAVRRKPNTTGESTKTKPRYRGPMVVTQVRPSDTYRISQLEPRNGRPYATIVHVSQLKAWRSWNEDDDDSNTNSHNEPEMQRSKRIVRKPLRYGDFIPDR
ncbi:hypothetical protein AVEN_266239-1, partial [Araneus ventricosus]